MSKKKNESEKLDTICENLITNSTDSQVTMQGIYRISLSHLASIPKLSSILIEKYTLQEQFKLFDAILVKCNSHSYNANKSILALKADVSYQLALLLIEFNKDELRAEIREEHLSKALALLDQSNILIQTHKLPLEINADQVALDLLKTFGTESIEGSYVKSFELAKTSFKDREEKLPAKHPSILSSLLTIAEIGKSIKDKDINIEAIKYAKLAYNMGITVNNLKAAAKALEIQADIFEFFGDEKLSLLLDEQAESLSPTTSTELKKSETSTTSKTKLEQIIIHGTINKNLIIIKEAIQESILDPIKIAASRGKWVDHKVSSGNIGVSGYLGGFLKNQLGELSSKENLEIALELCFEAVNLGIMSSEMKNPLCSAIFAQEYPETINNVLKKHPEYFVDGFILKTSLLNASEYAEKLLGHELSANKSYNAYFEKEITPYVVERLNNNIYKPIVKIITDASWNSSIEQNLLTLISEKYLTNTTFNLGTSYLGKNLGAINDIIKIVQVIAFKTIVSTILEQNSTNYSPISAFTKTYPEIVKRVLDDHPEYLCDNKTIIGICNQTLTELNSKNSEDNDHEEVTSKISVETDLVFAQNNNDKISVETEISGGIDNTLLEETY